MRSILKRILVGFDKLPLAEQDLKNLRKYKYQGVDKSLLSKYVLGRYWSWLVEWFPLWMAPNLITLIGLLFVTSCCILVLLHAPTMTEELPSWLYYYTAFALFAYQSMDAIDGKQARRTNTSGPLGELFDHGCDALNLVIMGLISPALFRLQPNAMAASLMCLAFTAFYTATWEEYHTGVLYLGYCSGPVEGTILLILFCIAAGWFGGDIYLLSFNIPLLGNIQFNSIVTYPAVFVTILTILLSIRNVSLQVNGSLKPFVRLIPFYVYMALVFYIYCQFTILSLFPNYLFYFILIGLSFAFSVSRLITFHVAKCSFPFWNPSYLTFAALSLSLFFGIDQSTLNWVLPILTGVNAAIYSNLINSTIKQVCQFLNIYCLSIKKHKTV